MFQKGHRPKRFMLIINEIRFLIHLNPSSWYHFQKTELALCQSITAWSMSQKGHRPSVKTPMIKQLSEANE
jgi:hypothetical protein